MVHIGTIFPYHRKDLPIGPVMADYKSNTGFHNLKLHFLVADTEQLVWFVSHNKDGIN